MITTLENDHDKASNVDVNDGDNLPHPDEFFSWIRNKSENESCETSVALQSVDNWPGLNQTSSSTAKSHEIGQSCESHPVDADDGRDDDIDPTGPLSDGSKGSLSGCLGSNSPVASCQLVGESQTTFSECSSPQSVAETTMCTPPRPSRSRRHSRKKVASTMAGYTELAAGRGPRTRARARAEASRLHPSRQQARPYSDAEDELLSELIRRKLQWEEIEKEFGQRFAGRDRKSLQGRWSRTLKYVKNSSAKCLRTRGRGMVQLD